MGCAFAVRGTAEADLSDLRQEQRRKLLDKFRYLAAQSPQALDLPSYGAECGRTFLKRRHGRHRCYLLGHSHTCSFALHTVVVNKDEHMDPHKRQLEGKLARS